jgi:large subunit ribosomal protein L21
LYAVIETGGKQYQVSPGDEIYIEKLPENGESVTFDKVLAVGSDDGIKVGTPYVNGAVVTATFLKNGKGKKINIFTYHSKEGSTYHRQGHRQPYTKVRIEEIK